MTAKYESRRAGIKNRPRILRLLDKTPLEIPASRRTIPDTREMVRQSVQAALRQSGANHGYDTVDEMIQEETDLDPMDPDPPWSSQYEVTEMEDIETPPLEEAQQSASEEDDDETETKTKKDADPDSAKQDEA